MSPIANADYAPEPILADDSIVIRSNPRAGTLKVNREQAIERTARLLLECPELGFDAAWRYCAGFEAGRWKRQLGHEVLARMVELEASPSV